MIVNCTQCETEIEFSEDVKMYGQCMCFGCKKKYNDYMLYHGFHQEQK